MNLQVASARRFGLFKARFKGPVFSRPLTPAVRGAQGDGVKTLEELAAKYGLAPADELAGSDSSRAYIDYGRPVVLADSSRGSRRTKREDALWSRALER